MTNNVWTAPDWNAIVASPVTWTGGLGYNQGGLWAHKGHLSASIDEFDGSLTWSDSMSDFKDSICYEDMTAEEFERAVNAAKAHCEAHLNARAKELRDQIKSGAFDTKIKALYKETEDRIAP